MFYTIVLVFDTKILSKCFPRCYNSLKLTKGKSKMKKAKRLLSFMLTLLMLATAVSFTASVGAAPTSPAVVYVKTGADGTGSSPSSPMGSISSAMNAVLAAGGGTVVLVGPVEISSNTDFGKGGNYATNIVFTSVYGGVDYRETADAALVFTAAWKNLEVQSPIEFENMDIVTNGSHCSIYGNGFPVVLGRGINCRVAEGQDANKKENYLGVYGGSACDLSGTKNFPAHTSVTVLSGTYFDIKGSGKGNAEKPRPSTSATITIGKDVNVKGAVAFDFNENGKVEGEKILILADGENAAAATAASEATRKYETTGNGYVRGVEPGKVYVQAQTGYAAKVGSDFVKNGEYESSEKTIKFAFEKSDLNKDAELALLRPTLPAAFPGEYIKGYDNGDGTFSFKPSGNITIAEASTIIVRLLTDEASIKGKNETDKAQKTDWFYDNVAYLDSFGSYDTFDNFDGNRQITRAEFVALISAFKKLSSKTEEIKFTDVDASHKYYSAIKAGTMAKLVNGYDNGDGTFSFKPDAPITRAEVVTVINRIFDMADLAPIKYKNMLPNFSDVEESHWAAFQIIAAAGGKEKPKEEVNLGGTGEVEHKVEGEVVFIKDGGTGDGSSAENATSYMKGHRMIKDTGTMVVCGPVVFNSNFDITLGNTGKVLVTSVWDGVDYRETADAALIFGSNWKNGVPRSETILDNIAIISRGTNCSIYCDNQKLTIGKDVVCIVEEKGAVVNLYAGSANDLSSCQNYIGSESTHVSHTGNYFGNLTINGGIWGNVSGTGNGSAAKPRENNGAVITIGEGADVGGVTGGSTTAEGKKVNGLRTIILNNYTKAIIDPAEYDIIVKAPAGVTAEAVDIQQYSITIKVTADNGKTITGLSEDGTVTFTAEGALLITETADGYKAQKTGKDGVGDIDDDAAEEATPEILKEIDEKTDKRIAEIKATKTEIVPKEGKTAYYVSFNSGNDENDGKSPEKAWKTVERVNRGAYVTGDVVYFKRGEEWRGNTLTAKPGVSYSAYGEGEKPILNMSPYDGAKHGTWTLVDGTTNIYLYSETFKNDIGSISFNNRTFREIYAQKMCYDWKDGKAYDRGGKVAYVETKDFLANMKNDLDFWHDCAGPNVSAKTGAGQLYLRSDKGNPAERFTNIEFNNGIHAISVANNVTIDNITVIHAGRHGISSGTVTNLRVQNCTFEWIGGSMQNYSGGSFTRFGNAVEVYGGCDGYIVDNCYITDVYDAGVTHQVSDSSDGDYVMKNVTYSNNVILHCVYSIEHFNRQPAKGGTTRYLVNILYKDNICRFAGDCFGYTRPDKSVCSHIRSGNLVDTANFVIEGNIFDRSTNSLFRLFPGGDQEIQWKNNTYIHKLGASYGPMLGVTVSYNSNIQREVNMRFKTPEVGGRYLFIKER